MNKAIKRPRAAGFTLLEVLVVVLIITILATLVGVRVAGEPGKARTAAAAAQIRSFSTALSLYRMQNGMIPTEAQGLQALVTRPTSPPVPQAYPEGGYLEAARLPQDPWQRDYVYLVPGAGGAPFEIISYGADGEPGGDGENGDVSSSGL